MKPKVVWRKQKFLIIGIVAVVLLIFSTVNQFLQSVKNKEIANADNSLRVTADNCAAQVRLIFDSYEKVLGASSLILENEEEVTSKAVLERLHNIALQNGCKRMSIDFLEGTSYTSDGNIVNISQGSRLLQLGVGNGFVSNTEMDPVDGEAVVHLYTPLYDKEENLYAALKLTITTAQLSETVDATLYDNKSYYHMVDANGNYVASSKNALLMDDTFMAAIGKLNYEKGYDATQIQQSFISGTTGYTKYSVGEEERYAYYRPVGINEWVLMMIVPKEVVLVQEQENIRIAVLMMLKLVLILVVVFAYIYDLQRRARRNSELNDKCFRALAKQSGHVIFEWDFEKGKIISTTNFEEIFGRTPDTKSAAADALGTGGVHPEDKEAYEALFQTMLGGENVESTTYRIRHKDGTYHWCKLEGAVVKDQWGKPYRAICSLEDVNHSVQKEVALRRKSETDQLTGLYNKVTTEVLIKEYLSENEEELCALMIIDIDHFKGINDTWGHQQGDLVLSEVAKLLKSLFRKGDIIGRIGGDEFFVFIKSYRTLDDLHAKAEQVCENIRNVKFEKSEDIKLSVSMGISLFPKHGVDVFQLYHFADVALYYTKENGKNGFMVYHREQIKEDMCQKRTDMESAHLEENRQEMK